jgi:hypothetical protein
VPPAASCPAAGVCLLTNNSVNVCRYGYSAAAIGIFTAFLHVFAPVSSHRTGFCKLHNHFAIADAVVRQAPAEPHRDKLLPPRPLSTAPSSCPTSSQR